MSIMLNKNQVSAFFGMIVCFYMISAAVPRLFSAFYMLYPEQINTQFKQEAKSVTLEQHLKSEQYTQQAISWFETGPLWQSLVLSQVRQLAFVDPAEQTELMLAVHEANSYSLSLSPVEPYAWYRQAILAEKSNESVGSVINNLRLSIYAARVEPDLLLKRIVLFSKYSTALDNEAFDMFYEQIRLASVMKFYPLLKLVASNPNLLPSVRIALRNNYALLNTFLLRFEKINKKNK